MDTSLLKAAADVGGWVFATVAITVGATWIIRWLLRANDALVASLDRQTAAMDRLTAVISSLIDEVRSRSGRR